MNIFHTLIIKISHIVTAVLVFVGLHAAPTPQITVVDIEPKTGEISVTAAATSSPKQTPTFIIKQTPTLPPVESTLPAEDTSTPAKVASPAPQPVQVPIYIIQQPTPMTQEEKTPVTASPASLKSLEIFSPMPNKGLGRDFTANPEATDDSNSLELGLIVRDDTGKATSIADVEVTATDKSQNKTMAVTGNIAKIYVDGEKQTVPYFPFSYLFKTSGDHTITFSANGMTKQVTINAK